MQRYDGDGIEQATIDAGLLMLRVVTGLVFFMHGYQKLVDFGISNTQSAFDGMGARLPDLTAVIVTFVEIIGGAALVMGALTRVFAILLVIDMAAAFFIVHAGNGFFVTEGGYELVTILGAAALSLVLTGPGAFSVDAVLRIPALGPTTFSSGRRA
jgi:putative oxidoreductase